jgi:hypothetical protein
MAFHKVSISDFSFRAALAPLSDQFSLHQILTSPLSVMPIMLAVG